MFKDSANKGVYNSAHVEKLNIIRSSKIKQEVVYNVSV